MHYGLARHFGANVDKHLEEKENMDDQINIKFLNMQGEINTLKEKVLKNTNDIYAIKLWKQEAVARFDQGVENRTKAFEKIEALEEELEQFKRYTIKGIENSISDLRYNTDIKLERIDDVLVVQRNQTDTQRKNYASLIKVMDEKVTPLIEGTHGKRKV